MKGKKISIIILLIVGYFLICATAYADNISNDIADSVFRLHVIANSDSKEDQDLKYKVRDNLIKYMNSICKDAKSKKEVIEIANKNKDELYNIAISTIRENGFNYNVKVSIGNFPFPTKKYGDISLPSGNYDALRIEIGKAKGQNWWCVMFPPLCFVDVSSGIVPDESKNEMKESMSEEDYKIISEESDYVKLKFKIVELIQNAKILTAKK